MNSPCDNCIVKAMCNRGLSCPDFTLWYRYITDEIFADQMEMRDKLRDKFSAPISPYHHTEKKTGEK